jgi:hypothetical protein
MVFGAAATAADLPKEGKFSVTLSGAGTAKATAIGKERLLIAWDENDLTVGTGIFDHATWHCFGLYDVMNAMVQVQGYCVVTDPAGDQIVGNIATDGKPAADAKSYSVSGTITTGTGKYVGITGGWTIVVHGPEFRTAAEGTYVAYGPLQGSYKLP